MDGTIRGSKGGSGSQHTPTEAPDSLHETEHARIVDAISEGPIKGFVHGNSNPMKDVYLNETPISNEDGSFNFAGIVVDSRLGTQTQDPMAQFANVENEIGVGVELRYGTPWVQALTDLDLDAVRVRLAVPQLQKSDVSTGDIKGYTVNYTIEVSTDGGPFVSAVSSGFSGKTGSEYDKTHLIELPEATDTGWVIRVTRTTTNADSATIADTTNVMSYTEIVSAKLRYPNTAVVGIIVDAKQFTGSVPSRAYHIYGRVISVPSNYNPTTRAYTGTWDGSFKPAWTDNPVWIYYDLVTHPRYGLGQWVSAARMNKWALYDIAQYCDELVPDGKGGQEPRFTCNVYIQSQQDAYKVLGDLTSIFRGMAFWAGGAIQTTADMPGDPEHVYTNANVVGGKFSYQSSDRKTRFTVALVSWSDPADFGRQKVTYVPDRDGIARYGVRQTSIIAFGATSEGQAWRQGQWALLSSRLETETVAFQVGQDGYLVAPGKIARIADAKRAQNRQGGRIRTATDTVVTIDSSPGVIEIGGSLTVMLPSGVSETRTISAINEQDLTVSEAFSETPLPEAMWVVETSTLFAQTVRIISIAEPVSSGDDSLTFTVTALQHNASKFDAVDFGAMVFTPPTVPVQGGTLLAPSAVSVTSYARKGATRAVPVLAVGWTRVAGATKYLVQYRRDDGEWSVVHTVGGNRFEVTNVLPGSYVAQVAAANKLAESVPAISEAYDLDDSALTPTILDDLADEVADAKADAAAAMAEIANFSQDGILVPTEKKWFIVEYNVILTEKPGIDAQATSFGVTTEKTSYDAAVSALTTYLGTIPDWNDITVDTTIDRTTFNGTWQDVYTAKQACLNAIYAAAKQKAQDAQDGADQAGASAVVQNSNFTKNLNGWAFEATPGPVGGSEFQRGTSAANSPYAPIPTHLIHNGVAGQTSAYAVNQSFIAVQAGQQVVASVALRSLSANSSARAQAFVRFYDKSGAYLGFVGGLPLLDPSGTTQLNSTVKGPAPANAAFGRICILYTNHTSGVITATCAMLTATITNQDDLPDGDSYSRTPAMTFHSETVDNATFASPIDTQGNVPGWAPFSGATLAYFVSAAYNNANVLDITGPVAFCGARSTRKYPCKPGDVAIVTADIYSAAGDVKGDIQIASYAANGNALAGNSVQNTAFTTWETLQVKLPMPANAAYFTINFRLRATTGTGRLFVTNVRLSMNDVRVAGSGVRLGDQRNMPTVTFGNYGSGWSSLTFNYTATTTSATITASAATLQAGDNAISYNSSSVAVTGSAGTTRKYYLYYDDPNLDGGSQTLRATTSSTVALASDARLYLGLATVTFPSSGTGSGPGGGGFCPMIDEPVIRRALDGTEEVIRAGDVRVGDYLRLACERWGRVTFSRTERQRAVRVVGPDGLYLQCSESAPLEAWDGSSVRAIDALGVALRHRTAGLATTLDVVPLGEQDVQHITCEDDFFWVRDYSHHNAKPSQ